MSKPRESKARPPDIIKPGYRVSADPYEQAEAMDAFRRERKEKPDFYGNPTDEETEELIAWICGRAGE